MEDASSEKSSSLTGMTAVFNGLCHDQEMALMLHGHITYPRVRLWDTDVEVAASRYANASVKIWKRCWNWKRTPCLPIKSGRYERLNQPNPADDHRLF